MTRNKKLIYASHALLFFVLCAVVFIPEFFFGGKTKDYPRWYKVGTTFLNGKNLYDGFYFLYPPFSALLYALPVPLGKIGHYFTMILVSIASWMSIVAITAKILGDQDKLKPGQMLLPIILVLPFLIENFDLGQPNVLLLALMLSGFLCIEKKQNMLAGLSFGTAVAIKLFPITVLPYLVWRRYWTTSAVLIITAISLNVFAPAQFRGFDRNLAEIVQWYEGMKGSEDGFGQRIEQNWSWKNQSIIALTHRYVRHLDYQSVDKGAKPSYINLVDVDYKTANAITLAVVMVIGLGFLTVIPRHRDRTSNSDKIELAILFCLMTIASPLARNYYFVWLYFPIATLVHLASLYPEAPKRILAWFMLVAATTFGLLALSIFPRFFQAAGNYVLMTGVLIFALSRFMKQERQSQALQRIPKLKLTIR